jgi:hypothetical protein
MIRLIVGFFNFCFLFGCATTTPRYISSFHNSSNNYRSDQEKIELQKLANDKASSLKNAQDWSKILCGRKEFRCFSYDKGSVPLPRVTMEEISASPQLIMKVSDEVASSFEISQEEEAMKNKGTHRLLMEEVEIGGQDSSGRLFRIYRMKTSN